MATPEYNFKKTLNAMLYVAHKVSRKDFHKIFKILYFADKEHLSEYGRVITGDIYYAMGKGPVPTRLYDMLKAARFENNPYHEFFSASSYMVSPKKEADLDELSLSDVEKLDEAIVAYGGLTMDELTLLSHGYAWSNTRSDSPISLENILRENGNSKEYIDFVLKR